MNYDKMTKKELLSLVREKAQINDQYDVVSLIRGQLTNKNNHRENYWLIGLNKGNKVEFCEILFTGLLDRCLIDPKEVFRRLLTDRKVNAFITAHNHPSGAVEPSDDDIHIRDKMAYIAELFGYDYLDDIIVTELKFRSAKAMGEL